MPTFEFNERIDQRSVRASQSRRVFTRVYQLETSERVTEADAYAWITDPAPGYGQMVIGSAYPDIGGDGTVLTSIEVEDEAADGKSWKVTAEWSSPTSGGLSANPLDRPAEITWSSETETQDIFRDYSSPPKEIVNTAGFPFDTLPQREVAYTQVQCTRNETVSFFRSTVLVLMGYYGFVVNSDAFTIDGVSIPMLKARLHVRSAERITEGLVTYYRVSYVIQIRDGQAGYESDGWRERYLSRGHYCLGDASGPFPDPPHPARDADGQIIEEAVPLDADGFYLGDPLGTPAVVGPFRLYREVSFAALGFE